MEKMKEILAAVLILYIIAGLFALLYQLLVWHSFSRPFSYTLLIALVSLKGTIISLRRDYTEQELNKTDWSRLIFLLHLSLIIFCLILFISFLLKGQQIAALISLLTLLVSAYRTKLTNPFTNTNP